MRNGRRTSSWGNPHILSVPYEIVRRPIGTILVPALLIGALLRAWGLDFGLPHVLAHPDESRVARTAVEFLRGDLHPGFFNYPTFFMYVLGAGYLGMCGFRIAAGEFPSLAVCAASWPHAWEPFFLTGRVLSALAGTLSIVIVYRLGKRLADPETGLGAAAFLSVAFLHVRDSHFAVTDVAMTALLLAALTALVRAHDAPSLRSFAGAGAIAGLAASTKYNAVLLAAAVLVSAFLRWRDDRGVDARVPVFGAAMAAAFVLGSPYAVLDWPTFWRDVSAEAQHLRGGHAIRLDVGWRYHAMVTLPLGLTLPLFIASLAGAIAMAWRIPARAALLLAFPLAYYAVAGRGHTVFARYMVPVVPFLCITAGFLVSVVARALATRVPRRSAAVMFVALIVVIGGAAGVKSVRLDRLLSRTDSRVLAAQWLAANVPEGSSIYLSGSAYGHPDLSRGGHVAPYELWRFDEVAGTFGAPRGNRAELPRWLVIQESPLVMYSSLPDAVRGLLGRYRLRQSFRAVDMTAPHVYDQQDAWYVPLDGFAGVGRPGPNISVYESR